jgi:ABC-type phosphate transport system substrate-binding protein
MFQIWRLAISAVVILPLAAALSAQQYPFKVIVRSDHPGTELRQRNLADIFLGKTTRWGDGSRITPVDQSSTSAVRAAFSREALRQPLSAVTSYWKRQLLGGRMRPPRVKDSDEAVIEHVASKSGAIGYVSADAQVPESVKVLTIVQ